MNYNKKGLYVILLMGLVIVSLMIPCVAAAPPQTGHPYMLFHDISEVPGYQYRTVDPWKTWEKNILYTADQSLAKNFSGNLGSYDRIGYRGDFARDLGLAYQITKRPEYATKAKEALLNIETGTVTVKLDKALALGSYSLAYDWIQPTLDPSTDMIIRDKLAKLADTTYKDLNDNGTTLNYIQFDDFHGQAYPYVGIAGAALYDYTNPNHLSLSSTPTDWDKAGKEYLFENDRLHSSGRALFSFGFDEVSGKHLNGAYKLYVADDFVLLFQVYDHTYGENLLSIYPIAKKAFISETWESLPNEYSNNYETNGNIGWIYQKGIISLLPDNEKSIVLNHIDRIESSKILPYSSIIGTAPNGLNSNALLYSVYGNYASIPRTFPTTTSYLDSESLYQVFRGSWKDDADWLALVTFNKVTGSNRDMMHNDQLNIEYYSRGDLLLADGGETKYVLDKLYGYYDIFHNTIAIENPRTPFPVSSWSGSASQGIFKGTSTTLITPVTVDTVIQMPWIQLLDSKATISKVMGKQFGTSQSLTSPVQYSRTILYPESDYFIIVDRMEGSENWIYRNIFRPTSLSITPTVDTNSDHVYDASEVGHVNGDLTIGTTPFNWQALTYKTETDTGINTDLVSWVTTNPYGKKVTLDMVTAPSSEILVTKHVGRIGGYGYQSEVYSPIIYMKPQESQNTYRVTALLSSYSTETAKTATEIAVTGTGHAIKVSSPTSDDYIYTGKGTSSFAGFTTDADTVYIRKQGSVNEYTLVQGSFLNEGNVSKVNISQKVDLLTLKQEGNLIKFKVKGENSADIRMEQTLATSVMRDGSAYTQWVMENNSNTLKISTTLSEHDFEISSENRLIIDPISNLAVNVSEQLEFPLKVTYTGTGVLQSSAANLPKDAAFNTTSRIFSWTPYTNQTGSYTVAFTVTDGTLSDSRNVLITVNNVMNQAPVLEPIGNKTVNTGSNVQFAVNATDPNGDLLTYSASGMPVNAMFDSITRTFSWTPYTNQTGSYTVALTVTDGRLSDSRNVLITVNNVINRAPVLEQIGNRTVKAGSNVQFAVNAADPDGDTLTYSASGMPVNALFDSQTRTFSWTPEENQAGIHSVTFAVSDGSMNDSETIQISVDSTIRALGLTLAPIADASVNQKEILNVLVTGLSPNGKTLTYSASSLPTGAAFNPATRQFTWSPAYNQEGNYTVSFSVSDGALSASRDVTFNAIKVNYAPYFTLGSMTTLTFNEGELIQANINAADWNRDVITYSATNLPTGATVNSATHSFSWTPGYDQAGTYDITLVVSDGKLQSTKVLRLIINDINSGPVLSSIADMTIDEGKLLTFEITATGTVGKSLIYSAANLPTGATFNSAAHSLAWTPAYDQAGTYNVTFSVSDGTLQDSKSVKITVNDINRGPVMSSIADMTIDEGKLLTFEITATGTAGQSLIYSAANLPTGATFNSVAHSLAWTPAYDQAGTYNVTFTVSDGTLHDSKSVKITVKDINTAPVLSALTDMTTDEGKLLAFVVTATDPESDNLTYSASGLPVNALFNPASQTFSWTPAYNQAGIYNVMFSVSDGLLQDSKSVKITVIDSNNAPVFGTIADASVNQKEVLNVLVTASDPDGNPLTYSATNLPTGATFNPATRQFTWSPAYNQVGVYTVTFSVSDGILSTSRDVKFTAIKVNYAPYFTLGALSTLTFNEGALIQANINAADWNQDAITYSATNLPKGATVNSATHMFSWTPAYNQAGTYDITLIVSDGTLQSSKVLRIIVNDTPQPMGKKPVGQKSGTVYIKLE